MSPVQNTINATCPKLARDTTPIRREGIQCEEFDGEAVLYDIAHHAMHYLNATAYTIWTCCDGRTRVEQMGDRLAESFEIDVKDKDVRHQLNHDVCHTMANLTRNGLIDLATEVQS